MTPQRIVFKRGDTVMFGVTATDSTGQPVDLSDLTVAAQVRPEKASDPWFADLELVWIDRAQGRFELWAPGNGLTDTWPVGDLRADIQYSQTQGSKVIRRSTETFRVYIDRDVTQ